MIPIFAQRADSSPFTKGDGFRELATNLEAALRENGMNDLARKFKEAEERMFDAAADLHTVSKHNKEKHKTVDRDEENLNKARGEQRSQIETIINAELSKMDAAARAARKYIEKAGNKLKALQQFIEMNATRRSK